ncbi:MAG TPA: prephenate dehydrogenase/arogenate dehydrogenase family protein [Candidatus Thermoplasmatota archaeon]|nr:prephenate dehydrogenase/arogenate dehydrogenase family protein [Candidatus Thermoplasmatota archaeon]
MTEEEIARLRDEIRAVDRRLVELTALRLRLAKRVGELKQHARQPIRNYVVEAEAIRLVRDAARELGVRPEIAEELLKLEIQESLRVQEKDRVGRSRPQGTAGKALVVGGAGNMGRWFVEFLESKGYQTSILDVRGPPPGRPHVTDLVAEAGAFDIVLLATPPSATSDVLRSLKGRTSALILDIASLKAPVAAALRELAASGANVASIHPMWGPGAEILAGRNVVVCDFGAPDSALAARKLFEDTAANLVSMGLEEHDRFMGLVLGLPHAVSLVFGAALAGMGTPFAEVSNLGGPTFQKQVRVSAEVAAENKDLYFEIQKLNPHTANVLARLRRSLDELEASLASNEEFRAYMSRSQRWFEEGSR